MQHSCRSAERRVFRFPVLGPDNCRCESWNTSTVMSTVDATPYSLVTDMFEAPVRLAATLSPSKSQISETIVPVQTKWRFVRLFRCQVSSCTGRSTGHRVC